MRGNRGTVLLESGNKIPLELNPCGVSVYVHRYIAWAQLALRKGLAHQVLVHVLLDLFETVLVTEGMNERNVG